MIKVLCSFEEETVGSWGYGRTIYYFLCLLVLRCTSFFSSLLTFFIHRSLSVFVTLNLHKKMHLPIKSVQCLSSAVTCKLHSVCLL